MHRVPLTADDMRFHQMARGGAPGRGRMRWGALVWFATLAVTLPAAVRSEPAISSFHLATESLRSDGVRLHDSVAEGQWRRSNDEFRVAWTHGTIAADYVPADVDLLGSATNLRATRDAVQASWRDGLDGVVIRSLRLGGYRGFTDYRSLWLDEYYRQLFEPVDGYRDASPAGAHAFGAVRWEYLPASGFVQVSVGWQRDRVAPGYEKPILEPLRRGRDRLTTWRVRVEGENVLSPLVRSLTEFELAQTTGRDLRATARLSLNWSLAEDWVLRLQGAATREGPFHSAAIAATLERDWQSRWFCGLILRGYRDNGQITDPLLISGAAPAQDTAQALATIHWQNDRWGFRLAAGPYLSRYAPPTPGIERFATLYADRDWWSLEAAFSWWL